MTTKTDQNVIDIESKTNTKLDFYTGAGWENRTPTYSLENCHSTIKLIPQYMKY